MSLIRHPFETTGLLALNFALAGKLYQAACQMDTMAKDDTCTNVLENALPALCTQAVKCITSMTGQPTLAVGALKRARLGWIRTCGNYQQFL
jgi:hypothetical protein